MLLEAVLSVGTDLELRATLQQIVEAAAALTGARYGAAGGGAPAPRPHTEPVTPGPPDNPPPRHGPNPARATGVV
ncbi:histidine kinase, partial [Streptomyces sp. NPDC059153]